MTKTKTKTKTNATHLKGRNGAKNEGEGGDDDKSDGDDGDNLTKDFKSAKKYFSLAGQKCEFSCLKLRALGENVFAQSCRSLGGDKSILNHFAENVLVFISFMNDCIESHQIS